MIYLFEELDIFSQEQLERGLPLLPPKRREYVLRFKQAADQKQSAVGWLLLAYGMRQEYGTKKIPDFQKTASGKPFFAGKNSPFLISATADPLWAADCTGKKSGWIFRS